MSLDAGRDVRVITTTTTGGSTAASNSAGVNIQTQGIDRLAGLYVTQAGGQLSVKAGQDVILQGAQIQSEGSVDIQADRDIHLQSVATGRQEDIVWNKNNTREVGVTQSVGTTIAAKDDIKLEAGNDIRAQAAELSAGEKLSLQAGHDIVLEAAVDEQSDHT